jgi:transposase, IS5 family
MNQPAETLQKHHDLFGPTRQVGADQIYATNANRKLCAAKKIANSFVRKGPKPKQPAPKDQMRAILSKARATEMEGTFGNQKQHYGLDRILARTQQTETLWICFGIWTASAVRIGKRMALEKTTKKAA